MGRRNGLAPRRMEKAVTWVESGGGEERGGGGEAK